MGILFVNDPHIADRPPLGRVEGYADHIMAKLEECCTIAGDNHCELTIFTGDLFHSKRPSFNSHALVQRLIGLFSYWPGTVYMVLGNHDLGVAGIESVARQPIGVLFRAGVVELLKEDVAEIVDGARVQLSPAHYQDEEDPQHYSLNRLTDANYAIKVAHGMIMPPGTIPPFEHTPMNLIDVTGADYVFYGHVHDIHGVHKVGNCRFVNYGSIGRIARTSHNMERDVYAVLWSPRNGVKEIKLKSTLPADEVFLEKVASGDDPASEDLKAYARELVAALVTGTSTSLETLLAEATEGVEKGVQDLVRRYLEEAGL